MTYSPGQGSPDEANPTVRFDQSAINQAAPHLAIRLSQEANIGLVKKEQQDFHGYIYLAADPGKGLAEAYLLVVADGVSMGEAGALASQTAVETLLAEFKGRYNEGRDPAASLDAAIQRANYAVFDLAQTRPGMATTCVAALLVGNQLLTAHVGDSRAYLHRPSFGLVAITTDHSWTEEYGRSLVRKGKLSQAELATDRRRHTITRAFGLETSINADFNQADLEPGDVLMLCSDGLWDMLGVTRFEQIVTEGIELVHNQAGLNSLTRHLVDSAMQAGGRDNISLTIAAVDSVGGPVAMPALEGLLHRTAQDLENRLNPFDNPNTITTSPELPAPPAAGSSNGNAARSYQPIGRVLAEPQQTSEPPRPAEQSANPNLETVLNKGQQTFALGDWEQGLEELFPLEQNNPDYRGVFEVLSNLLQRYIGMLLSEGHSEKAETMLARLHELNIHRYDTILYEYALEESRKAASERNYLQTRAFAEFALKLRPGDTVATNILDLVTLYLDMNRSTATTEERLSLAQRIYARDPDFGGIQDDLAAIYMELGDMAAKRDQDGDAVEWYRLIKPLRPKDARLVSLAASKQRAIEDDFNRHIVEGQARYAQELPVPNGLQKFSAANVISDNEGKPESEALSRLKERVSRAQKAWDNGRKEIGAEYIYLVDQLSLILSPNPWQPTFPRVCYDYGKWLLDQKQYDEARPYFLKAQAHGMSAAQQRLAEIDRASGSTYISPTPVDLPDDYSYKPMPNANKARQPLVDTKINLPNQGIFVGANGQRDPDGDGITPLAAYAKIADSWEKEAEQREKLIDPKPKSEPDDRYTKTTKMVGVSGTLRNPNPNADPLQHAAMRMAGQVKGSGIPPAAPIPPKKGLPSSSFRVQRENMLVPAIFIGIIAVAVAVVIFNILRNGQNNPNPAAANATATTSVTSTTVAIAATSAVTVKIEGADVKDLQLFMLAEGETTAAGRELAAGSNGSFTLPTSAANSLDPTKKYVLLARPKDTLTRKYRDLALDAPTQLLFVRGGLSYSSQTGLEARWRIEPDSFNFYPLADPTSPPTDGSTFVTATNHYLKSPFLEAYNTTGGLNRYGYAISEEFDSTLLGGRVQFFERGWLVKNAGDDQVRVGEIGKNVVALSGCSDAPQAPASVGTAPLKIDAAFDKFIKTNPSFGTNPLSPAFEVSEGNSKKKVQYFDFARVETFDGTTINLGLLGTEYAKCKNWYRT